MTDQRLLLSTLFVERFGPWSERSIHLPDHPFVVIAGPNEIGKSSLATLISWLLVGPSGSAADAQRYGAAGVDVGGRLTGTLRGQRFDATGSFQIKKAGAPNENRLSVRLGDEQLDAAGWRHRLGGVDAATLAAIYRWWGQDLHDGGDAEQHLSKVALAGIGGRRSVRSLLDQWERETRVAIAGRAAGVVSLATLEREIDVFTSQLNEAGRTTDEHLQVGNDREALICQRNELESRRGDLQQRLRVIDTVLGGFETRTNLRLLEQQAAALDPVPPTWQSLVDDPEAVRQAIDDDAATRHAVIEAEAALARALASSGFDVDLVSALVITDTLATDVTKATARLTETRRRVDAADDEVDLAQATLTAAAAATERGLLGCEGADRRTLARSLLSPATQADVAQALAEWDRQLGIARTADTDHQLARAEAERQAAWAQHAAEAWQRWGTDTTPHDWLRAGHLPASAARAAPQTWRPWVAAAVVAAVAAVAVAAQQWVVAGAAVAATIVAWFLARPDSPPAPLPSLTAEHTGHEQLAASATDVIVAERTAADARQAVTALAIAEAHAKGQVVAAHRALIELCQGVGLPVAGTVEATRAVHQSWIAAAELLRVERDAEATLSGLQSRHASAVDAARTVETELASLLTAMGLPDDAAPHGAEQLVSAARDAQRAWRAVDQARTCQQQCQTNLDLLLAPVAEEVAQWRPERVVEHVDHLVTLAEQHAALRRDIEQARHDVTTRLGDDPDVLELAAATKARHELDDDRHVVILAIDDVKDRYTTMSEDIGRLDDRLAALEQVECIAALRAERGALHEQRRELVVEAAATATAVSLLRRVADDYERLHQPAIVAGATELARSVADQWDAILALAGDDGIELYVEQRGGRRLRTTQLSTGGRALLYLAFRASMAEHDAVQRGLRLPLVCDDPLVHLDDDRAERVLPLLAAVAGRGHQVLLLTCHQRTVDAGRAAGAEVVHLG